MTNSVVSVRLSACVCLVCRRGRCAACLRLLSASPTVGVCWCAVCGVRCVPLFGTLWCGLAQFGAVWCQRELVEGPTALDAGVAAASLSAAGAPTWGQRRRRTRRSPLHPRPRLQLWSLSCPRLRLRLRLCLRLRLRLKTAQVTSPHPTPAPHPRTRTLPPPPPHPTPTRPTRPRHEVATDEAISPSPRPHLRLPLLGRRLLEVRTLSNTLRTHTFVTFVPF